MSQAASERAEEAARGAKTLAADAIKKAEDMAKRMEKAQKQTVTEVNALSSKVDEALDMAKDALGRIKSLSQKLFTEWEMGVIIVSVVVAAIMLGFGLVASMIR